MLALLVLYTVRQELTQNTAFTSETFQSTYTYSGGAIYTDSYDLTLTACIFEQCKTTEFYGGAIYFTNAQRSFSSVGCTYRECSAARYSAFYALTCNTQLLHNCFIGCSAANSYACFYSYTPDASSTLDCCSVCECTAQVYNWIIYARTVRRTNTTQCMITGRISELYIHGSRGPVDLKFALSNSNTAGDGGVFHLRDVDSSSSLSHIISTNSSFEGTYRFFYLQQVTDPCITISYLEIGRDTELLYVTGDTPAFTLADCWLGIGEEHFSGITAVGCHFEAQTKIPVEGSCEFFAGSSGEFTVGKQLLQQAHVLAYLGLMLTVVAL